MKYPYPQTGKRMGTLTMAHAQESIKELSLRADAQPHMWTWLIGNYRVEANNYRFGTGKYELWKGTISRRHSGDEVNGISGCSSLYEVLSFFIHELDRYEENCQR